jgi:hypothetical protein
VRVKRNPGEAEIRALIAASARDAVRCITCERSGERWCWPFEDGTHAQGARFTGARYTRPPGAGDVIVAD